MFEKHYAIGSVKQQFEEEAALHRKIETCSQNTGCFAMFPKNAVAFLCVNNQRLNHKLFLILQGFIQSSEFLHHAACPKNCSHMYALCRKRLQIYHVLQALQDTLFRSVQRASVRETEGTTAGLTTLFGLVMGTERIKRRRNLR